MKAHVMVHTKNGDYDLNYFLEKVTASVEALPLTERTMTLHRLLDTKRYNDWLTRPKKEEKK